MPAVFAGMLLSIAGSLAYKVLAALGISFATYQVSQSLKPYLVRLISNQFGSIDSMAVQAVGLLQLDVAIVTLITTYFAAISLKKSISVVSSK